MNQRCKESGKKPGPGGIRADDLIDSRHSNLCSITTSISKTRWSYKWGILSEVVAATRKQKVIERWPDTNEATFCLTREH